MMSGPVILTFFGIGVGIGSSLTAALCGRFGAAILAMTVVWIVCIFGRSIPGMEATVCFSC
jgi:hypothetical protein